MAALQALSRRPYIFLIIFIFCLAVGITNLISASPSHLLAKTPVRVHGTGAQSANPTSSDQPRIIGLVFYGRRSSVRILDCYLQQNLKSNGGLLDEVIFVVHTDVKEDLAYLENELLPSNPAYSRYDAKDENWPSSSWESVTDPNATYVKIDDDVVYFEKETIGAVVKRLQENPQYLAVSANVVNNPALSYIQYHLGAYLPYWPEMKAPSVSPSRGSWRASDLPSYEGPADGPAGFEIDGKTEPPFEGHRWLPVRTNETVDLSHYPVSTMTYNPWGPSLTNWAAAAQLHYSFLQHLEEGSLDSFKKLDLWDYVYDHMSINFYAIRGRDIMDAFPFPTDVDDEGFLTEILPRKLGRHVIADGKSLAVHFSFHPQSAKLAKTNLLGRYAAYADAMVCNNRI